MKISASLLASPVLANSFQSCFDDGDFLKQGFQKTQIGEVGKSTFTVANGIIQCEGLECRLTCDSGYHFYGGNNISKCKEQFFGKWKWTMDIAECKTCDEFNWGNSDVEAVEKLKQWGDSIKKVVKVTCPGYPQGALTKRWHL